MTPDSARHLPHCFVLLLAVRRVLAVCNAAGDICRRFPLYASGSIRETGYRISLEPYSPFPGSLITGRYCSWDTRQCGAGTANAFGRQMWSGGEDAGFVLHPGNYRSQPHRKTLFTTGPLARSALATIQSKIPFTGCLSSGSNIDHWLPQ
jgi:hypothetical protein